MQAREIGTGFQQVGQPITRRPSRMHQVNRPLQPKEKKKIWSLEDMKSFRSKRDNQLMVTLRHSKLRQKRLENTLVCFVQALVNSRVVIELRNDIVVKGRLRNVDDQMNCRVENGNWTKNYQDGFRHKFDYLHVPGRQIVYVHIPDKVDVSKTLDDHFVKKNQRKKPSS